MKFLSLLFCSLIFLLSPALAQTPPPPAEGGEGAEAEGGSDTANRDQRFWEVRLPRGNFLIALDRINSIAKHEYIISNAALRVTELTVTSNSNSVVRFYYVEPMAATAPRAGDAVRRGRELIDRAENRAGQELSNQVTKEYPVTTHTGQVEYRVSSPEAVEQLHRSAVRAWKDRRGRVVTVQ